MFAFPTFLKVKRYHKKKKIDPREEDAWVIDNKYVYIRSKDVISFHPWTGPTSDRANPSWVIKWYAPDKKIAKFYLVDDPQYKSYFDQYRTLSNPNSVDHLIYLTN